MDIFAHHLWKKKLFFFNLILCVDIETPQKQCVILQIISWYLLTYKPQREKKCSNSVLNLQECKSNAVPSSHFQLIKLPEIN